MARFVRFLLRFLLFLVPLMALGILAFVGFSFVGAQLEDVPEPPKVALLRAASDQPLDLRPETLERSAMGLYLRLQTTALDTPAGTDGTLERFLIEPGETALTVASRLEEDGFISDASLFRNYMRYHGIDQRLAAGDFEIAKNMTMPQIAEQLQRARYEEIVLTIPEGMRAEEVADLLDVKGVMDGQAFLALVRGGSASVDALGDYPWLPAGLATLEGYLFPDTYRLPARATPVDLVRRMLDNFQNRVTDEMLAPAVKTGRSVEQVINMAAIVEREAPWRTTGRWSPAFIGTVWTAAAPRRRSATICRPIRPCSTQPAGPASGGGSRLRWRPTRPSNRPTTPTSGQDCRQRPSPALGFRPSRPRPRRPTPSTASSSPPAMAHMSTPPRWPSIRRTSRGIRSDQ